MIIKNLVYLSYGDESEYRRALFSILSFLSWHYDVSSVRIILYTDAPDFFRNYLVNEKIEYFILSPQILTEMSGMDQFIHRRKVAVIGLTFEKYPNEDQLFIDSDAFFISKAETLLTELDTHESFMHVREYKIEEALTTFASYGQGHFPRALIEYMASKDFEIGGKIMRFTSEDYSWNSGVLGLSCRIAFVMPDILKLTDEFYSATRWFLCEQLAFSFILQRLTQIRPSNTFICHYWGRRQKSLMDDMLLKFFSSNDKNSIDNKKIRSVTNYWNKMIENDLILEQIEIAKLSRSWFYAGKKIIRYVLANGFKISSYKDLMRSLNSTRILL